MVTKGGQGCGNETGGGDRSGALGRSLLAVSDWDTSRARTEPSLLVGFCVN